METGKPELQQISDLAPAWGILIWELFGNKWGHQHYVRKPLEKWCKRGSVRASSALLELVPENKKENLEFELPLYDPSKGLVVDLAVVGGGPAGLAVAQQVSEAGFARCLVQYDKPYNPGYQVAYGILAEVEGHPFDLDKMIFLEETSLVARPGVPMEEIQQRMEARLRHLGIKIKRIEEDERCVIPMGGPLPVIPQRVVGIGGTAGLVHPSTGYMVARTLAAAPIVASSIVQYLSSGSSQGGSESVERVWKNLWPIERRRQREYKKVF
ncbi:Lycopene beta cyclase chloroplastic/chromoplastic [Bienertia sinuspersici]